MKQFIIQNLFIFSLRKVKRTNSVRFWGKNLRYNQLLVQGVLVRGRLATATRVGRMAPVAIMASRRRRPICAALPGGETKIKWVLQNCIPDECQIVCASRAWNFEGHFKGKWKRNQYIFLEFLNGSCSSKCSFKYVSLPYSRINKLLIFILEL